MAYVELFSPPFWLAVLALMSVFIAGYFILRQALIDSLTEWSRRERERQEQDRLRGGRR